MAKIACSLWEGSQGYVVQTDIKQPPESKLLWLSSVRAHLDLGWKNKLDASSAIKWTIDWVKESEKTDAKTATDLQIREYFEEIA